MKDRLPTCLALALALALALTLALAPAAAASDPQEAAAADLQEEFNTLERRLLQAQVDGDAGALGRLLAPDFEYARAIDDRPLRGIAAEKWQKAVLGNFKLDSFEIHDSRARELGDGMVQAVTRVTLHRVGGEAGGQERLVTSTWFRDQAGVWKIAARVSVKFGGLDREALRAAWRERSGGAAGEAGDVDREAMRERFRQRLEAMDPEEREALRQMWSERTQGRQAAEEGEPAAEEAAEEDPPNGG